MYRCLCKEFLRSSADAKFTRRNEAAADGDSEAALRRNYRLSSCVTAPKILEVEEPVQGLDIIWAPIAPGDRAILAGDESRMGRGMSCKNRSALDVQAIPAAGRKTRRATGSRGGALALLAASAIFGAALGFAQPGVAAELGSVGDNSAVSALITYAQQTADATPNMVVAQAANPAATPAAKPVAKSMKPRVKKPAPVADASGYAAGDPQTCLGCHSGDAHIVAFLKFSPMAVKGDPKTPMASGGCESCHGASAAHVASRMKGGDGEPGVVFKGPNASPVEARNEVCEGCHEGGMLINWQGSQMQRAGVACADCHTVHAAKDPVREKKTQPEVCFACHAEQRADSFKYSHHPIREGKVVCSDCHAPMGSAGPHLLKEFSVNETCYNCHADKRGPMLWEHQPVREDCTNCHTPHGSVEQRLMKENMGFMCSSCHSAISNSSGGAFGGGHSLLGNLQGQATYNSALGNNRLCLNCHSQVHGSNSPNGAYFLR